MHTLWNHCTHLGMHVQRTMIHPLLRCARHKSEAATA
jgi:nitrite reductase/ring-hydroxylating ferredoxin subunit